MTISMDGSVAAADRLERMRANGYFRQPRSVSEVWCQLKDDGTPMDLVPLGQALGGLWRRHELLHAVQDDGQLRFFDVAEAASWPSVDPAAGPA
ncbi:hypothetical protein [Shumkonia mesophila]|uniref:hypothetical protein n=1 Tax=Shumkonia mesophila TaxID=2838854 RepID=UPI00293463C5|nr:hypothetical protein [Shumkonia mesophila]